MDNSAKLALFLESSFLSDLLKKETVTDISYNGERFFYQDNLLGRNKADISIAKEQVGDFLRQIANYSEKQFSYQNPILDVSFSKYRLNATYSSLTRVRDSHSYSFSLRIEKEGSRLFEDNRFFPGNSKKILLSALNSRQSIIIAGETGSGKTELQKYLLLNLKKNARVIVIDNVEELELTRNDDLDLTSWLIDENNRYGSFKELIKNALRNNPDYLIIAESRGEEMMEGIASALSGHPLISTIHSFDLESIPSRMARLAMMGGKNLVYEEIINDIYASFSYFVFLKKEINDKGVKRYIDSIGKIDRKKKKMEIVFPKGVDK